MSMRIGTFVIAAMLAASTASAQPTPGAGAAAAPATHAVHHLVYEFGYNQKAASSGNNTGKTTIDFVGAAADGGVTVKATDEWWNAVQPKQSSVCELYANGNVTCSQAPYNFTGIQQSIVPLLGKSVFAALSGNPNASWNANYNIKATFAPSVNRGFAGQVTTWNGTYSMKGHGTIPEQPPLILIKSDGTLKQQGGRYTTFSQQENILFDPRIGIPVLVNQVSNIVPRQSTNNYQIEIKLIQYK